MPEPAVSSCCSSKAKPVPSNEAASPSPCCSTKNAPQSLPAVPSPPQGPGWKAYTPLAVILAGSALSAGALMLSTPAAERTLMLGMSRFMGVFLVVFAMLKLFDLPGFVKGFSRYDLLAGPVPAYGYVYPFLELGFGLALLSGLAPFAVNLGLAVLMFFGAGGVLRSLARKEQLNCACMGSSLNVPLSTVAVVEDVGMGLMSVGMLLAMAS